MHFIYPRGGVGAWASVVCVVVDAGSTAKWSSEENVKEASMEVPT